MHGLEQRIIQYTLNKGKNQQFRAKMNLDGSFSFFAVCSGSDKKFIYTDAWDYLELDSGFRGDGAKFRLAYTGNGWFRVTTKRSEYEDVLQVKSPFMENASKIVADEYNPNNLNQYWAFEKV